MSAPRTSHIFVIVPSENISLCRKTLKNERQIFLCGQCQILRLYNVCCISSMILTPWSTVLPEKLTGPQLVKKFPAFYGTRRFITVYTTARHLSLSWARSIQTMTPIPRLKDPFYYYSSIYASVFQVVSFPQVSPLKPCMHLSSPRYVLQDLLISVFLV
jgi:hypothetical protein